MSYIDTIANAEDLVSPGISACPGCVAELILRDCLKILGPKSVIGVPPGCMGGAGGGGWDKRYGLKIPSTMPLLENCAPLMSGIKAAYETIDPEVHSIAFAGDGATADTGLSGLSAAAERRNNIVYICYDNEGYMNTGFQKSGTTPHGARTSTTPVGTVGKGKLNFKKDVPMMLAMQDAAYVATLSPAYMNDFVAKVEKAASIKDGLVYLHIFSTCPTGWGTRPEKSIEYMRKAVDSRYFLLWEYREGMFTISNPTRNIRTPLDVTEFLKGQKRFGHMDEDQIRELREFCERKWEMLQKVAVN